MLACEVWLKKVRGEPVHRVPLLLYLMTVGEGCMTKHKDEVYGTIRWNLAGGSGLKEEKDGGAAMNETLWMCDQMRAGQVYTRKIFDTEAEAQAFMQKMMQAEPDAMFNVEAIQARQVWN